MEAKKELFFRMLLRKAPADDLRAVYDGGLKKTMAL
jgi:hypothetical protein